MDLEGLVHDLAKNGFVHWRCICIEVHNPIEIVLGKNKVMYRYSFIKKLHNDPCKFLLRPARSNWASVCLF